MSRPTLIAQVRDNLSELAAGEAEVRGKDEILAALAARPFLILEGWTFTRRTWLEPA